ncbi:MAG: hypothetical protein DI629_19525 [Mesorhizobium amorphae]|nr:MAG: hypothetical protein DI629_19525 [Mesorhizobium amorphae]
MRLFLVSALVSGLVLGSLPALAQGAAAPPVDKRAELAPPAPRAERIDALFSELKREGNPKAAERVANRIRTEWNRSGSASVDLMMGWARDALQAKKYAVALDFLDQVVVLRPDYPEGWNLRATTHFAMNNYAMAMGDIERTLQREPRHWGALTGLATIMKNRGSKELALDAYTRVLSVYPMLREVQNEVGVLSDELAGQSL